MSVRRRLVVPLALAAALTLPAGAHANQAYDKVAAAYAQAGGQLEPCTFTEAELEAALRGIPKAFRNVVPQLRQAIEAGIVAHRGGNCRDGKLEEGTTGGAQAGGAGTTTTVPTVTTQTAPAVPAATTPTTPTAAVPTATAPQPAAATPREHDRTPLVIALIALGALVLALLLLWALARVRGWDPPWVARVRHGWSEAGFRTTSTWSEFTDWLRLGR